jgi:hypothetical protein
MPEGPEIRLAADEVARALLPWQTTAVEFAFPAMLTPKSVAHLMSSNGVIVQYPIINQSDAIYMSRKKHSKQEIEDALCHAEENSWRVEVGGSHAWGKIYCPYNS